MTRSTTSCPSSRTDRRRTSAFALAMAVMASLSCEVAATEAAVGCVDVRTRSAANPSVRVWYRVPAEAHGPPPLPRRRVLVLFGGRNCDGREEVSGKLGWPAWADLNGVVLVAPTLRDDGYWDPARWSGRALLDALAALPAECRASPSGLLYYGYSAGSQAANLFAAWRPDLCRAYVAHACGVFPEAPRTGAPGLVTCGVEDGARLPVCRLFACRFREAGGLLVWKTLDGGHAFGPAAGGLARAFFAAVAEGRPCAVWGEDDTLLVRPFEAIDPEYRNPLWTEELRRLWSRR